MQRLHAQRLNAQLSAHARGAIASHNLAIGILHLPALETFCIAGAFIKLYIGLGCRQSANLTGGKRRTLVASRIQRFSVQLYIWYAHSADASLIGSGLWAAASLNTALHCSLQGSIAQD